ncbi:MAG: adenosine kinase [Hyphomicrobiaceae bacterium]
MQPALVPQSCPLVKKHISHYRAGLAITRGFHIKDKGQASMADERYDVVGIGNAIVDIIARCDDPFLVQHDAPKGHMRLVDRDTISRIYADAGPAIEISGGSAANTIAGVASFGGNCAYVGKVADDDFGDIFTHDMRAMGVTFDTPRATTGIPTARSLILVTPDGERTMNTFLGVSPGLAPTDLDEDIIAAGRITYLEGYLFDAEAAKAAFRQAALFAHKAGRRVSITLSDGFCVDRHRTEFLDLIVKDIDILFANESEITSLYQVEDFDDALSRTRADTAFAVLTRSESGSVVVAGNETISVPAFPIDQIVDSTGAGDLYAAGFLFGLSRSFDLERCARLGSFAAAQIISQIGARSDRNLRDAAIAEGLL